MAFAIKFDDFTFEGVARWQETDSQRVSRQSYPRRHARLLHNFAFRDRRFVTLSCEVFFDTAVELETYLENMKAAIFSGLGRLYRLDNGRYLTAILTSTGGLDDYARRPGTFRQFTLEFECEPFWYGATSRLDFLSQAPGANMSVPVLGKVDTPPVIEVSGPTGAGITIQITNTTLGMGMTFVGDLVSGQSLVWDHVNGKVIKGGAAALENVDVPNFWDLKAEVTNNIRYDGPDTANVSVQWLDRWH